MAKQFSWDYEESRTKYYQIYSVSDKADELLDTSAICLTLPRSDLNDFYVGSIVLALNCLAAQVGNKL